jgi:hypothetical protein
VGTIEKAITQKDVENALESHVRNALFRVVVVGVAVTENNIKFVQKEIKIILIKFRSFNISVVGLLKNNQKGKK